MLEFTESLNPLETEVSRLEVNDEFQKLGLIMSYDREVELIP